MTTHDPAACRDCADEEIARLRAELAEARETNRRLNRRVQAAEADVAAFRWFVEHDERAAAYLRHCPSFAPLAAASAMVAAWKAAEERGERIAAERDAALARVTAAEAVEANVAEMCANLADVVAALAREKVGDESVINRAVAEGGVMAAEMIARHIRSLGKRLAEENTRGGTNG